MTGTNYCNPEALLAFATSAESIGESIEEYVGRVEGARVGREAFGKMPFIGQRIYDAYDEHVEETRLGVSEAKSALFGAAAGAAMSAGEWLSAEAAAIEEISGVGEES